MKKNERNLNKSAETTSVEEKSYSLQQHHLSNMKKNTGNWKNFTQ